MFSNNQNEFVTAFRNKMTTIVEEMQEIKNKAEKEKLQAKNDQ